MCRAAITCFQKHRGRLRITNAAVTSSSCTGLYIKDNTTGIHYLVDTGALCSMYPVTSCDKNIIDTDPILITVANGSTIPTHGTRDIQLHINGRKYTWTIRLAEVTQPLLGSNFLVNHNMLVHHTSSPNVV